MAQIKKKQTNKQTNKETNVCILYFVFCIFSKVKGEFDEIENRYYTHLDNYRKKEIILLQRLKEYNEHFNKAKTIMSQQSTQHKWSHAKLTYVIDTANQENMQLKKLIEKR